MAWTVNANGNTTTDGSEDVIVNDTTTAATFQFCINCMNMASGDALAVRVYKTVTGDSQSRVVYSQTFTGSQSSAPIQISPAIGSTNGLKVTIQRTSGSDHAYLWELIEI